MKSIESGTTRARLRLLSAWLTPEQLRLIQGGLTQVETDGTATSKESLAKLGAACPGNSRVPRDLGLRLFNSTVIVTLGARRSGRLMAHENPRDPRAEYRSGRHELSIDEASGGALSAAPANLCFMGHTERDGVAGAGLIRKAIAGQPREQADEGVARMFAASRSL